jgi:hypothetical protein
MAPETLPVLRCESRRCRPEPRWGLIAGLVVVMASMLDALWLVPAQQRAAAERDRFGVRYRCVDAPKPPAPTTPTVVRSRTADVKVEGVYLMKAPAR